MEHSGVSHWTLRAEYKKCKEIIWAHTNDYAGNNISKYRINLKYNSRLDPDNCAYSVKAFLDSCRANKILAEDRKGNNRGVLMEPDESLPHNTYVFTLINLDDHADKTSNQPASGKSLRAVQQDEQPGKSNV